MIGFEFTLNGRHVCTAGLDEPGVLTATLVLVLRRKSGVDGLHPSET